MISVVWNSDAYGPSLHLSGSPLNLLVINNSLATIPGYRPPKLSARAMYMPVENVGWVKGANIGLAMSTAPYVVLMNDDCEIVTENWLEKMAAVFDMDERIA